MSANSGTSGYGNDESDTPNDHGDIPADEAVCPHCIMLPCVAEANSTGAGQPAHIQNQAQRKSLYKRFWNCIHNLGGWTLPSYEANKITFVGGLEGIVRQQRGIVTLWVFFYLCPCCDIKTTHWWLIYQFH